MAERTPDSVPVVVVTGPTATGKTRLGVALARRFAGEIVSADSRQVYRGLDLGTGKDLAEYGPPGDRVPVHLLDVADPREEFHLFRYLDLARNAILDARRRDRLPIVVGGSPLYLNALLDGYALEGGAPDPALRSQLQALETQQLLSRLLAQAPDLYARTDKTQRRRLIRALEIAGTRAAATGTAPLALEPLILAPYYPRQDVHERIGARLDARLAAGLIEEVERLHRQGLPWERLEFLGLEYRDVARFLQGRLSRQDLRERLFAHIRQFCKHQDIWFRKMEREGKAIHWIPGGDVETAADLVRHFRAGQPLPRPAFQLKDVYYGPRSTPASRGVPACRRVAPEAGDG